MSLIVPLNDVGDEVNPDQFGKVDTRLPGKKEFRFTWCEAGPPHYLDDEVDLDQWGVRLWWDSDNLKDIKELADGTSSKRVVF